MTRFSSSTRTPTDPHSLKSLNMLCVRLVFCLYAEDAGIFGGYGKFHNYLKKVADRDVSDVRPKLIELFRVLDTKEADRDSYMEDELASFSYVNGGLFADESIEIPRFNEEIVHLLLDNVSENFNWRDISPTIFGAVFESTLNPETRRSGGMHYTSIENIHKVIDPLFLDGLRSELDEIKEIAVDNQRKLEAFQKKLASLTFLNPACGSGNFLTETYLSLRKLKTRSLSCCNMGRSPSAASITTPFRYPSASSTASRCGDGGQNCPLDRRKPDDAADRGPLPNFV